MPPLPRSYIEILIPLCWYLLGGGVFGRWLAQESGAVRNGISAFTRRGQRASKLLLPQREDTRIQRAATSKTVLTQIQPCWHPGIGLPGSSNVRKKCLVFISHQVYDTSLYQPQGTETGDGFGVRKGDIPVPQTRPKSKLQTQNLGFRRGRGGGGVAKPFGSVFDRILIPFRKGRRVTR